MNSYTPGKIQIRSLPHQLRLNLPITRYIASGGVILLLYAYLHVLHNIIVIVGDQQPFLRLIALSIVGGVISGRILTPLKALGITGIVFIFAGYAYTQSLPGGIDFIRVFTPMMGDAVQLLGGVSVLRIFNADMWVLAVTPGPVFLGTYFAIKRQYTAASVVAGSGLGLLILTGDASVITTLLGVIGMTIAIVVGDYDRRGDSIGHVKHVGIILVAVILLTLVVGIIPGTTGTYVSPAGIGGGDESSMEANLVYADDSITIQGPIELDPFVRYTVTADEPAYWRVSSYDRYTGGGWVRSGAIESGSESIGQPSGPTRTIEQTFTAESPVATLPSAWRLTSLEGVPVPVQEIGNAEVEPASPLEPGESYEATSEIPDVSPDALRDADESYPTDIRERYTQLPSSTPDRVSERTEEIAAAADNPYDTATIIESWLQEEREYSLNVERPEGDIADAFLFEMEAGYCTYYATTMVTMLRTQGIPARFVTGYAPGEQIDDNEWIVRGANSHAWVEVYFPEYGWITFDPTPGSSRIQTERELLQEAREEGFEGVDPEGTSSDSFNGADRDDGQGTDGDVDEALSLDDNAISESQDDYGGSFTTSWFSNWPVISFSHLGMGAVLFLSILLGLHQLGIDNRIRRELWLLRVPNSKPKEVVTAVYYRMLYIQQCKDQPKHEAETIRSYISNADTHVSRIGEIYEQSQYSGTITTTESEEAVEHLSHLLEERSNMDILGAIIGGSDESPDNV